MKKVIVSSCLLGNNVKYNGGNNYLPKIEELKKVAIVIPICPETFGGLKSPRAPAEIIGDKVMLKTGIDVTNEFNKGAQKALQIAIDEDVHYALLKKNSPSCGTKTIYDGTFSHKIIFGSGIATRLFKQKNISLFDESEIDLLIKLLTDNN